MSTTVRRDRMPDAWLTIWQRLPLVAAMDALVCLSFVPVLAALTLGWWPLGLVSAVVLVGPAWAGCAVLSDALVRDPDEGSVRSLIRAVWRNPLVGMRILAVPAVVTGISYVTLLLWRAIGQPWLLVSLAVDCIALGLVLLGTLPAFALRVRGTPPSRGRALWRTALEVVAAAPLHFVGIAAVVVILVVLAGWVGTGLLFLLPGPVALLVAATTRSWS